MSQLGAVIQQPPLAAGEISTRRQRIHRLCQKESAAIRAANYNLIHPRDLEWLFHQYDASFFQGELRRELAGRELTFRLSKTMTRAGGKTTGIMHRGAARFERFEIAVGVRLLYRSFAAGGHRQPTVTGMVCRDRLEALQRIFEHELIHLVEMMLWNDSSCTGTRFQRLANARFGHREHTHGLITPREEARVRFGVYPGCRVRFRFENRVYFGIVNRVTQRATVLVPDPSGERYSDGRTYSKFYIPLPLLERVG